LDIVALLSAYADGFTFGNCDINLGIIPSLILVLLKLILCHWGVFLQISKTHEGNLSLHKIEHEMFLSTIDDLFREGVHADLAK